MQSASAKHGRQHAGAAAEPEGGGGQRHPQPGGLHPGQRLRADVNTMLVGVVIGTDSLVSSATPVAAVAAAQWAKEILS